MEAQTVDFVIVNDTISEIVYVFMYGVLYISCIIMFTRFTEPSWDCVQADAGTPVEGANYPQITGYRSGIVGDNPNIQMLGTSRAVSVLKTQIIICQCCKLDSEQSMIKKELLLFIGHDFPQHSLPTNLHYDSALFAFLLWLLKNQHSANLFFVRPVHFLDFQHLLAFYGACHDDLSHFIQCLPLNPFSL